jgi:hypothetical protein
MGPARWGRIAPRALAMGVYTMALRRNWGMGARERGVGRFVPIALIGGMALGVGLFLGANQHSFAHQQKQDKGRPCRD